MARCRERRELRAGRDRPDVRCLQPRRAAVNEFVHHREPASIDDQPVIRQNRDTLYSSAIVDISEGATLTLPDAGDRYLSVMVVNNDHYINRRAPRAGRPRADRRPTSTPTTCSSPPGSSSTRTIPPISLRSTSSRTRCARRRRRPAIRHRPTTTRPASTPPATPLLTLSRGVNAFDRAFGRKEDVDPVKHLLGTASGWGGLPEQEAFYLNVDPGLPKASTR